MGFGNIIVIGILLIALGLGSYMFYTLADERYNQQSIEREFTASPENELEKISNESVQFYPNMRFSEREITYEVEDACSEKQKEDVIRAFNILDELTILDFSENPQDGKIRILCSNIAPKPEQKNHFVAGEGGPTKIINASRFYVIEEAEISLFRQERCEKPNIALHEILHGLGFDHTSNKESIMYPVTDCEQEVTSDIISEISELYLIPSRADLTITKLSANTTGRYLNFGIWIENQGLKDVNNATLLLRSGNEQVGEFSLNEIFTGRRVIFTVNNIRLPRNSEGIVFEVKAENEEQELNIENNKVSFSLANE